MNPQTQSVPTSQYNMAAVPQNLQDLAGKTTGFLSSQIGQNAPAYPYAMAAPMSSGQLAQAGVAGQMAGPQASTAAPAAQATNQLLSGDINPYTAAAMQGPGSQALDQILGGAYMPQNDPWTAGIMGGLQSQEAQDIQSLHSTYGAGPGVNTGVADLEGRLRQQYAGQAANLLQNQQNTAVQQQLSAAPYGLQLQAMPYQAYQQAQQNQLNALSPALQAQQAAIGNLGTAGGTQQQTMQNYLTAAYQDYLRQIQQPWTAATAAQPYAAQAYAPQGIETTTTPSLFSQLLSTGAAAAPFFIKK